MSKNKTIVKRALAFGLAMILTICAAAANPVVSVQAAAKKKVTSVSFSKDTIVLKKGKTYKLKTTVKPKNASNKSVSYKSSKKSVAQVNANGKITAKKAGMTKITAKAKDGSKKSATCKVYVYTAKIKKATVTPAAKTLQVGKTVKLKTKVTSPKKGTANVFTWKTSNKKVAVVNADGKVTAKGAGTATITGTAMDGSKKKVTCKITVEASSVTPQPEPVPPVTSVLVTSVKLPASLELNAGSSSKLNAEVEPANASNKSLTWTSSAADVAEVDAQGNVTAKKPGTANVTAAAQDGSGKSAVCVVTVKEKKSDLPGEPAEKEVLDKLYDTKNIVQFVTAESDSVIEFNDGSAIYDIWWNWIDSSGGLQTAFRIRPVAEGSDEFRIQTAMRARDKRGPEDKRVMMPKDNGDNLTLANVDEKDDSQIWSLRKLENGNYIVVNKASQKVISLKTASTEMGTEVCLKAYEADDVYMQWRVQTREEVIPEVEPSILLDKTMFNVGDTAKIEIGEVEADEVTATYASSDETIATVDENGTITAVKSGSATITIIVKFDGKTFTFNEQIIVAGEELGDLAWQVASPDGNIKGMFVFDEKKGSLCYAAYHGEDLVIEPSPLGLVTNKGDFREGLTFKSVSEVQEINDSYQLIGAKVKDVTANANEITMTFEKDGVSYGVVARAYDDGIAFRYKIEGEGELSISGENTGVKIPLGSEVTVADYDEANERIPTGTPFENLIGNYSLMMTYQLKDKDVYALVSEADLQGSYCVSMLQGHPSGMMDIRFCPKQQEVGDVVTTAPFESPWRYMVIGSLSDITLNTMAENLNPPCKIEDTSWVKPGAMAWTWVNGDPCDDFDTYKEYIDLAVEMGWQYLLLDEGWYVQENRVFVKYYDWTQDLIDYADEKGIGLIVWAHKKNLETEEGQKKIKEWADMGFKGFKPDFFDSGAQDAVQLVNKLVELAAENKMLIDPHGVYKPTGIRRTYPNALTQEGISASEGRMAYSSYNCTLPYTRLAIGPADYAPLASFSNAELYNVDDRYLEASFAGLAAEAVLFESGMQCLADKPANYEKSAAKAFYKNMPAEWDESVLVDGKIGKYVNMARRSGENWYMGIMCNDEFTYGAENYTQKRDKTFTLDFLEEGKTYTAEIYSDGAEKTKIETRTEEVKKGDSITVSCLPYGGAAIKLTPQVPVSITVAPVLRVVAGESKDLTPEIKPEASAAEALTWTCDKTEIATVENGKVTGVKAGRATVTAAMKDGTKASCKVIVSGTPVKVEKVTLNKTNETIAEGAVLNLVATLTPEHPTDKNIKWSSSNEEVARVNSSGEVTGYAAGTATITATADAKTLTEGAASASCTVEVVAADPSTYEVVKSIHTAAWDGCIDCNEVTQLWWNYIDIYEDSSLKYRFVYDETDKDAFRVESIIEGNGVMMTESSATEAGTAVVFGNLDKEDESQLWKIQELGDGKCALINKKSGLALASEEKNDSGARLSVKELQQDNVYMQWTIQSHRKMLVAEDIETILAKAILNVGEMTTIATNPAQEGITYTSLDESIVTTDDGKIKAVAEGVATIETKLSFNGEERVFYDQIMVGNTAKEGSVWQVTSPDGKIKAVFALDKKRGSLTYAAFQGDTVVVEPSPMGLVTSLGDFTEGLVFDKQDAVKAKKETYELKGAKVKKVEKTANETTLWFKKGEVSFGIGVRVYDDGVAFRYKINGSGALNISAENTGVKIPADSAITLMPYDRSNEGIPELKAFEDLKGRYSMPMTYQVNDDTYVLVSEAQLEDTYCGAELVGHTSGMMDIRFCGEQKVDVMTEAPFESPWRFAVIGTLSDITLNTMAENLNPDPEFDTSWVEAGAMAWTWVNGDPCDDFETYKNYIDLAAEMGWKYLLMDEGWQPYDRTNISPGRSHYEGFYSWTEDLLKYAEEKGIGLVIWVDKADLDDPEEQAKIAEWAEMGFKGIKPDFFESASQSSVHLINTLIQLAADNKMVIDLHGVYKPTGMRRTYPNALTQEGVSASEGRMNSAEYNCTMLFNRIAVGPADYAPMASFGNVVNPMYNSATLAGLTAEAVLFESGLQCLADKPKVYRESKAYDFYKNLPSEWDESLLLGGDIRDYVNMARRSGENWYVGMMCNNQRDVALSLDFLADNTTYTAAIYKDGQNKEDIAVETLKVKKGDTINISMLQYGGAAIKITPDK
ncbi:hypothetical protein D3Z36_08680 [Lachnospiraceae bacterium]|nr:hypothetical protein [Lachnospiraceae bacterium]